MTETDTKCRKHHKNYLRLTAERSLEGATDRLFIVETDNLNGLKYKINYKCKAKSSINCKFARNS
jgi:ribosomal protein L40E